MQLLGGHLLGKRDLATFKFHLELDFSFPLHRRGAGKAMVANTILLQAHLIPELMLSEKFSSVDSHAGLVATAARRSRSEYLEVTLSCSLKLKLGPGSRSQSTAMSYSKKADQPMTPGLDVDGLSARPSLDPEYVIYPCFPEQRHRLI